MGAENWGTPSSLANMPLTTVGHPHPPQHNHHKHTPVPHKLQTRKNLAEWRGDEHSLQTSFPLYLLCFSLAKTRLCMLEYSKKKKNHEGILKRHAASQQ
jgi:hypothetical protein